MARWWSVVANQPTGRTIARLQRWKTIILCFYFLLNVTSGHLFYEKFQMIIAFAFFIVIITFPVSAWFCFKVSPTIWEKWNSAEIKLYPLSYHAGGERIRESGHLPAWWKLYKNLFPTKQPILVLGPRHLFICSIITSISIFNVEVAWSMAVLGDLDSSLCCPMSTPFAG